MFYNDIRALRLIFHLFYSIFRLFWQSLIKLRTVRKRFLAIAGLRVRRVCRNRQSGNYFFILFFGEESSCLLIVGDFEDPSVVGVIVDELRVRFQFLVDIGNLSLHGGVDISCDFHALYHCSRVVCVKALAHAGQLEVSDLAELLLGVVGDADSGYLLLGNILDPLVTLGEVFC